jgi:gliding motility-associated lipoprotein GldB
MDFLKKSFLFLLAVTTLAACKNNRLKFDVEHINASVEVHRIEQDLFGKDLNFTAHTELSGRFGDFYRKYVEIIINAGPAEDSLTFRNILHFREDGDMNEVYSDVTAAYPDLEWLQKDMTTAFKYYRHYFPEKSIPSVATFTSGFNYALAATDSTLGVGLDMYLGSDYKYYTLVGFPQYKTSTMKKEYIVPDAVKAWLVTEFDFDPLDKNMLEQIVHNGKIMYLMDALLPDYHDTLKIGYTAKQLDWAQANEGNIWGHFIDGQLLFSANHKEIMKYINEGPFTPGLPRESPPKAGIWLGWQIVRAFMEKQDEINLQQLIETDAQEILKHSKYKPRR